MARYDVYPNPAGKGYLLDVQADIFEELGTRVVIPLVPKTDSFDVVRTLNPIVLVDGERFALFTHLIGTIPKKRLPHPKLNLRTEHDNVVRALDMLLQGF